MELNKVQKTERKKKSIRISIGITPEESEFMKERNISPTAVLREGLREIQEVESR